MYGQGGIALGEIRRRGRGCAGRVGGVRIHAGVLTQIEELALQVVYVDADGCPVKDECYKVARRCGWKVCLVANKRVHHPVEPWISMEVVDDGFDAADDWIVGQCGPGDVVITADLPLADRCLKMGARAVGPKGRIFTEASMGEILASREISSQMREHGVNTGGPAPFTQKDRSRFLQALDTAIQAAKREFGA